MASARFYSSVAVQTTTTSALGTGDTVIPVADTTGFPVSFPYTLALDYGAATEELVSVTGAVGLSLTVSRAFNGTSAQSHGTGAVVKHVACALDFTDFRSHEAAASGIHGIAGSVVGTSDSQTLTNKTLASPAISSPAITGAATFAGSATFNSTMNAAAGGSLAGTFTGSPTLSGTPVFTGAAFTTGATSTTAALNVNVTGDAGVRLLQRSDGLLLWGDGTAAGDTNLYRSGVGALKTDTSFAAAVSSTAVSGDWTMASGWTYGTSSIRSTCGVVNVKIFCTRTGANIAANGSGNITDTLMATMVSAALRPNQDQVFTFDTGGVAFGTGVMTAASGAMTIKTMSPTAILSTGDTLTATLTYLS